MFGDHFRFLCPPGRRIPRIYRFPYSCNPVFANDSYGRTERANNCSRWPMLLQQYADNKRCIAANIRTIYVCRSESFERICSQQTAPPYRLYADDSCQPWQYAYTTGQSPKPVFVWQERDGYELFCSVDAPLFHHIISAYCYMGSMAMP